MRPRQSRRAAIDNTETNVCRYGVNLLLLKPILAHMAAVEHRDVWPLARTDTRHRRGPASWSDKHLIYGTGFPNHNACKGSINDREMNCLQRQLGHPSTDRRARAAFNPEFAGEGSRFSAPRFHGVK